MNKHYCGYDDTTYLLKDKDGNNYRITVGYDDCAEDPREWSNVSTMLCFTRRYKLGDSHNYDCLQEALEELADRVSVKYEPVYGNARERDEKLIEDLKPYYCIQYLYFYDHSVQSISTSSFVGRAQHADWDSGIVGFAYISKEDAFKNLLDYVLDENGNKIINKYAPITEDNWYRRASEVINGEVETYNDYIEGNVYSYRLEKEVLIEKKCPYCGEIIESYTDWEEEDACGGFFGDTIEENGIWDEIGCLEFVE